MKHEQLSNVGVQDMDTSGYQVSDLDNKENSHPTTAVSERPTRPPALLTGRPFATRKKMFLNLFREIYFNRFY